MRERTSDAYRVHNEARIVMAMVTAAVPLEEVLLAVAAVVG